LGAETPAQQRRDFTQEVDLENRNHIKGTGFQM
jgi:hypothetical protein